MEKQFATTLHKFENDNDFHGSDSMQMTLINEVSSMMITPVSNYLVLIVNKSYPGDLSKSSRSFVYRSTVPIQELYTTMSTSRDNVLISEDESSGQSLFKKVVLYNEEGQADEGIYNVDY